jgi:hypothetical protein
MKLEIFEFFGPAAQEQYRNHPARFFIKYELQNHEQNGDKNHCERTSGTLEHNPDQTRAQLRCGRAYNAKRET